MSRRDVTSEEKRLWREATKRDKKFRAELPLEEEAHEPAPVKKMAAPSAPRKPQQAASASTKLHPPRMLSLREAKKQLKAYPEIEATLDLHGFSRSEAFAHLREFIAQCQRRHKRHLLIITGKGAGVLKAALPGWLAEPPLANEVVVLAPAAPEKGGSGALHVIVRKR